MKLLSVLTSPSIYHIVLWLHAQVLPCVQKWLSGGNQKTHHKKKYSGRRGHGKHYQGGQIQEDLGHKG